jgi:hypothetical protein
MSMMRAALVAVGVAMVAATAFGVAGCGKTVVDEAKLQDTLKAELESSRGEKVKSVDCPSDIEVKPGTEFDCTVTPQKGKDETAVLKIRNENADIEVVEIKSGDVDLSLGG